MIPLIMRYLIPILLLTSTVIFANEKKASECLDIKDPTLRLSCYDSLFKKEPIEEPKLLEPQKKQDKIVLKKDKEIKKERERRFGLPERKDTPDEKVEIRSKINKVTQLTSLRLDITLDNDQKWRKLRKGQYKKGAVHKSKLLEKERPQNEKTKCKRPAKKPRRNKK